MNEVLHKGQTVLSNIITAYKDMAHCFNNIFCHKTFSQGIQFIEESHMSMMVTLEPLAETDITALLKRSSNDFGAVDSTPICLIVSRCSNKTDYKDINKSLYLGVFLKSMKAALVKPLIIKIQFGL